MSKRRIDPSASPEPFIVRPAHQHSEGHTYGKDEAHSVGAALGGQLRGFEYEAEDRDTVPTLNTEETRELSGRDAIAEFSDCSADFDSPEDALDRGDDYGRAVDERGERNLGSVSEGLAGAPDLRYGGEDLSGVSEWLLRAHSPALDDGLTAGDFLRSDEQILQEVLNTLTPLLGPRHGVQITVQQGLVTITGTVKNMLIREEVVDRVLRVYGVQEVLDRLSVLEGR
jgi:hypothetical protein